MHLQLKLMVCTIVRVPLLFSQKPVSKKINKNARFVSPRAAKYPPHKAQALVAKVHGLLKTRIPKSHLSQIDEAIN